MTLPTGVPNGVRNTEWCKAISRYTPLQCHNWGNIYRSDVQVTFGLYVYFRCLRLFQMRSFIPNKTTFTEYCLTQWISKLLGSFEFHWVRQYLVNFTNVAGTVNVNVYKTKPIFTGLGHGKLSILTLLLTTKLHVFCKKKNLWLSANHLADQMTSFKMADNITL